MRYFSLVDANNTWLGELWKIDMEVIPWQEFYWSQGTWKVSDEFISMWLKGECAAQEVSELNAKSLVPEAFESPGK
jgi:hypothetical protein